MNNVFVTGANGMLGSSICRELLRQGYSVKAMCLPNHEAKTLQDLPLELVYGELLDKAFLEHAIKGCDYIIHIAALNNVWPRRSKRVIEVNYEGTKNIMEIAEKFNIIRMVHIGSASSFGNGTAEKPGNETFALNEYNQNGFPVIIINPTFMIGPFDSGPTSGAMLLALAKGQLKWFGSGGKNFVCSTDVAMAAVNAIKLGKVGECYIAGNQNLTYKDFLQKACNQLKRPFNLRRAPNLAIVMIGFISSLISKITGKKPRLSLGMALIAQENQYFSSEKAVLELKMPQTPIETGIEASLNWFKLNKYL
jgi:dihydroflavonol-4-reductase